ncbi:hypothetical protein Btru_067183 [Bulinus truncatus]|nr:hypothetical protein Btru_067183 [Bulinus truncatus]
MANFTPTNIFLTTAFLLHVVNVVGAMVDQTDSCTIDTRSHPYGVYGRFFSDKSAHICEKDGHGQILTTADTVTTTKTAAPFDERRYITVEKEAAMSFFSPPKSEIEADDDNDDCNCCCHC